MTLKPKTKKNLKITAVMIIGFGVLLTPPLIIASKNETLQEENQKLKKELEEQKEKRETQLDELEIKIDEIAVKNDELKSENLKLQDQIEADGLTIDELQEENNKLNESLTPEQIAKAFVSVIGSDQDAYKNYEEAYKLERKRLYDED